MPLMGQSSLGKCLSHALDCELEDRGCALNTPGSLVAVSLGERLPSRRKARDVCTVPDSESPRWGGHPSSKKQNLLHTLV